MIITVEVMPIIKDLKFIVVESAIWNEKLEKAFISDVVFWKETQHCLLKKTDSASYFEDILRMAEEMAQQDWNN